MLSAEWEITAIRVVIGPPRVRSVAKQPESLFFSVLRQEIDCALARLRNLIEVLHARSDEAHPPVRVNIDHHLGYVHRRVNNDQSITDRVRRQVHDQWVVQGVVHLLYNLRR